VDDGVATGSTMRVALRAVKKAGAKRVILAVPVAPKDTLLQLRPEADELVCLEMPDPFIAVGAHYIEFSQLTDAKVIPLLEERHRAMESSPAGMDRGG
jgi:putative phosphoribosyl transferase